MAAEENRMSETPTWETVYAGPQWQVAMFQGLLEGEGITTFTPDQITKTVDPFITGGNALTARLQVPSPEATAARELLAAVRAAAPEAAGDSPQETAETPEEEVEGYGRRTRWAAVLVFTAPAAIVFGIGYILACREHGLRARQHGLVVAAMALAIVLTASLGVWIAYTAGLLRSLL
jgi:hypothetical protein